MLPQVVIKLWLDQLHPSSFTSLKVKMTQTRRINASRTTITETNQRLIPVMMILTNVSDSII